MPLNQHGEVRENRWLPMSIVAKITSVARNDLITVWHGTDHASGHSIATGGLNHRKLSAACIGAFSFWGSLNQQRATEYAWLNSAVQIRDAVPVLVSFSLPALTLREFFQNIPPLAYESLEDEGIEFRPETFAKINETWTNVCVTTITEMKWSIGG